MKQLNRQKLMAQMKFNPHPKQAEVLKHRERFQIWACGRRWGKTVLAAYKICEQMFLPNKKIWLVAPTYDLVEKCWSKVYGYGIRELKDGIIGTPTNAKGNYHLQTSTGSIVEARSADRPESLIGEGLDLVVIDEAARVKELAWTQALRPTLMDSEGEMIAISTPKGKNWFYNLFIKGQDPEDKRHTSFTFPSHTNPHLKESELVEITKDMPEIMYKQEILAQFLEDAGQVFRGIREAVQGGFEEPKEELEYVGGADVAKHEDFTVIWVARADNNHCVYKDRFKDIDWGLIKDRIKNASKKYNEAKIYLDSTGVGDPIYDDLVNMDVNIESYKFTNESKMALISNLSVMLENHEITFPSDDNLINELQRYGYEQLPSGKYRYGAPEGMHDDDVTALMLCAWAIKQGSASPDIRWLE